MRERGKPYGKTDSCYVTEVNGNPGTGIINVTKHNHFIDLVDYVATRKNNKAKPKSQNMNTGNHASSLSSSYPTDMIHASTKPQQVVNAFAGLILNDATPQKIHSLELLVEEILENANASDPTPIVDDMTKIAVDIHIGEDRRFAAYINKAHVPNHISNFTHDKWGNVLSEASAQALEMFMRKKP